MFVVLYYIVILLYAFYVLIRVMWLYFLLIDVSYQLLSILVRIYNWHVADSRLTRLHRFNPSLDGGSDLFWFQFEHGLLRVWGAGK